MSGRGGVGVNLDRGGRPSSRRGRWVAAVAVATALGMVGSGTAAAAAPPTGSGWHGLGWDLPALQAPASVPGTAGTMRALPYSATAHPALTRPPAVAWPAAGSALVDLPATGAGASPLAVGRLPVAVTRGHGRTGAATATATHAAGRVEIDTVDHAVADRAGISGTLLTVTGVSGDTTGPISISLDYGGFAAAYGADFGGRLRLVTYPACMLTSPERPACRQATPLDSVNSERSTHVTGEVTLPPPAKAPSGPNASTGATVLTTTAVVGVTSGTNSGGGDFTATGLTPAGSWTSGGASGDFTYSYPIALPATPGGSDPSVALSYSSQAVDGLTSATNNQPSAVGDGWSLGAGGFIERSYKQCSQDLGGNNGQTKTGDQCWATDNATLSLGHINTPLVKDVGGTWHPKQDDGSRVEKLTGAANGALGGEYWRVTTVDGTQYYFGLNHLPGWQSGNPETQSTWTEPVFGNNPGEPCNQATFAASSCQQAWRWNLDYVVDPHGNATVYYYQPETNYYGLNLNVATPGTAYTRGGYLTRIEYGFNTTVGGLYTQPPARVTFDTAERCLPSGSITCDPSQLNSGTANSWPDVPTDQICAQGAVCPNASPTFFSRRRLTTITTQVASGSGGWNSVNQWSLNQNFPTTGDGSASALWLASVIQTGLAGGSVALPPTTFTGTAMANRVDAGSNYTALTRSRITAVTNDMGGVTSVNYSPPDTACATKPAQENNGLRCFPSYWTPGGATAPVLDWFNKYVVTDVTNDGRTSLSQQVLTHYDYTGGAAWHYDENVLGDPKYRTWSEWRGYNTVRTTVGEPDDPAGPQTVTQALYLRGMDGDTLPGGGIRRVSVTDSLGEQTTDAKQLPGYTRESLTYLAGQVIAGTVSDPWISSATGTDTTGVQSFLTGTAASRSRTWLAASSTWRNTQTLTTYNSQGLVTQVENDGDVSIPAQATCTRTTYAQNTSAWLLSYPQQSQKVAGTCAASNQAGSGNIVSDAHTWYDHQGYGVAPTVGNPTETDTLNTWPAGGSETFQTPTSTIGYDSYGRVTSTTDALGRTSNTAYTPTTGGPVTQIAVTSPPISATNTATLTSTKYLDPVSGALVAEVNGSGLRTDATYDALGRLTAVWQPGTSRATNASANATYAYTTNSAGLSVLTTGRLLSNGQYATSYALADGLGRTVQTQAPTPYAQGGRLVSDTLFDSQGRGWKTHNPYWNGDSGPNATLLIVQDNAVPDTTVTNYDSAGRATASIYQLHGTEQWRTTTAYDGDRVTTVPPAGGTATTTVTNGLGQRTQLLQYRNPTQTGPGAPADTTSYTYTPAGLSAAVTDSTGNNTWTYGYDLHGRKTTSTDPDSGTTTFGYDAAGQLLTTTAAGGKTLAYTYDNLSRKTAEYDGSTSGTKLAAWNFDTLVKGLPTSSVRYIAGAAYTSAVTGYDTAGRATGTRVVIPFSQTGLGGSYQFATAYDPNTGAVLRTLSPAEGGLPQETTYHGYDTLGDPTTLDAADTSGNDTTLVSETDYNANGQVLRTNYQSATLPNQVSVTNTYADGTNRLASTLAERATTTNYMITNRAYGYDQAGDITSVADTPQGATADTQCFGYDYLQRLAQAWTPNSGDCTAAPTAAGLGGAAPYWQSWTFDPTGNRLTQTQHTTAGDTTSTSTYPTAGAAQPHTLQSVATTGPAGTGGSSYTYDLAGNTLTTTTPAGTQTFIYDSEGHVATATDPSGRTSSYFYNADGTRFLTKDPTGATLTIGDLELFVPTGATSATGTRFYAYNGQPIAERTTAAGLTWLMSDRQGTTYAAVNAATLAVSQRWQDPYGNARGTATGSWPDKHGYLGDYQNTTGLTHIGARDYDPTTGRFTTLDPVLDTSNPQQANGYAYASNNPTTSSDPTGLYTPGMGCPDGQCGGDAKAPKPTLQQEPGINQNKGIDHVRSNYFGTAPGGTQRAVYYGGAAPGNGIIVARFFIPGYNAAFGMLLGDNRGFSSNPDAGYRMALAWDTETGKVTFSVTSSTESGKLLTALYGPLYIDQYGDAVDPMLNPYDGGGSGVTTVVRPNVVFQARQICNTCDNSATVTSPQVGQFTCFAPPTPTWRSAALVIPEGKKILTFLAAASTDPRRLG